MDLSTALTNTSIAVGCMMIAMWLLSVLLKDASIVDIGWGSGFVLIVWVAFIGSERTERCWLLATLATVWGLRLSAYLAKRNHGKPEDYRYAAMREKHGSKFPIVSFFTVFLLQGIVMLIVSLPLQAGLSLEATTPLNTISWIGALIWIVGFAFEAGGDWQLAKFKSDPNNKGQVLDSGFWRYTRHPNYFGDFMIWWGLYLVALGSGKAWWSAIGPAIMSFFLIRVSGVAMLEKAMKKKPGYEDYIARTNAFFPWFPRRSTD